MSRTNTKHSLGEVFTLITEEFKKPGNYFLFTLGVLSEFFSGIKDFLPEVRGIADKFNSCFAGFGRDNNTPQALKDLDKFMNDYKTPAQRKSVCEKNHKKTYEYYALMTAEKSAKEGNAGRWFHNVFTLGLSAEETLKNEVYANTLRTTNAAVDTVCDWIRDGMDTNAPEFKAQVLRNYSSKAAYVADCKFFGKLDCGQFEKMENGIQKFASDAYGFFTNLNKVGNCIKNIFNTSTDIGIKNMKAKLYAFFEPASMLDAAATQFFHTALNIVTLGIYGAVKAVYYFVELSVQITEFWKNSKVDTAFKLGGIVGKAILIVKSLVLGRRRRRKLMRRKI